MSDEVSIEDLDKASVVRSEDELVLQQEGTTKTVTLALIDNLLTYVKTIAQTTTSSADAGINEITVTLSNGSTILLHTRNGSRGNSVSSITQTASPTESEGVNTIKVTLTDGQEYSFEVKNGKTGNGISSVSQTKTSHSSEGENEVTINMTDGTSKTVSFYNGEKGEQGESGVSIATGSFFTLEVDSATGNLYCNVNEEAATAEDVPIEIDSTGNVYYTVKEGE